MSYDISSLEPNSHKYKKENKQKSKVKPVVSHDKVVSTKKPLGKKISDTFLTEDVKDVKKWIITDVLIPEAKNIILDFLSMMFFGEATSRSGGSKSRRKRNDYVDYRSSYGRNNNRRSMEDRYDSDERVDFRNIILRNRDDAEAVVDAMRDRIDKTGSVSVADLLDLIDVPGRYTDNNYGWDDERDIGIRRVSSGYLIDVCEPKYLD